MPALAMVPISQLGLAAFERILTIILHVNLTVIVWNGFQKNQRVLYLIIATTIHGLVNSLIPILSSFTNAMMLIEGALTIVDILLICYSYYSRKYYVQRRNNDEQIKI
jgi:uncharacterized membrane protein YhfC